MKATLDPDSGRVTLELTMEEWLFLPYWNTPWERLTELEDTALRALLRAAGNPEGDQAP